jgi:hypothetical protein
MSKRAWQQLPEEIEIRLQEIIAAESSQKVSFKQICNLEKNSENKLLFGTPGSDLRRRVQQRRRYLLKKTDSDSLSSRELTFYPHSNLSNPKAVSTAASSEKLLTPPGYQRSHQEAPDITPKKLFLSPQTPSTAMTSKGTMETYALNFIEPWHNPFGMMVLRANDVEVDGQCVDKIRIFKPIFDIRDQKHYTAALAEDGSGFFVEEPVWPHYLLDRGNLDTITDTVDGLKVCADTKKVFKMHTTTVAENEALQTKAVFYAFPKGVTCNNNHFNDENGTRPKTPLQLKTSFHLSKHDLGKSKSGKYAGSQVLSLLPFLKWEMVIDDANMHMKRTEIAKSNPVDALELALQGIGLGSGP